MSAIQQIRQRLGISQREMAAAMGCSTGNISHYERRGQEVPPAAARRLIAFASQRGQVVTFDEIYGESGVHGLNSAPAVTSSHPSSDVTDREAA